MIEDVVTFVEQVSEVVFEPVVTTTIGLTENDVPLTRLVLAGGAVTVIDGQLYVLFVMQGLCCVSAWAVVCPSKTVVMTTAPIAASFEITGFFFIFIYYLVSKKIGVFHHPLVRAEASRRSSRLMAPATAACSAGSFCFSSASKVFNSGAPPSVPTAAIADALIEMLVPV